MFKILREALLTNARRNVPNDTRGEVSQCVKPSCSCRGVQGARQLRCRRVLMLRTEPVPVSALRVSPDWRVGAADAVAPFQRGRIGGGRGFNHAARLTSIKGHDHVA